MKFGIPKSKICVCIILIIIAFFIINRYRTENFGRAADNAIKDLESYEDDEDDMDMEYFQDDEDDEDDLDLEGFQDEDEDEDEDDMEEFQDEDEDEDDEEDDMEYFENAEEKEGYGGMSNATSGGMEGFSNISYAPY